MLSTITYVGGLVCFVSAYGIIARIVQRRELAGKPVFVFPSRADLGSKVWKVIHVEDFALYKMTAIKAACPNILARFGTQAL